ncbi:MAG TPA: hypothetical protein PLJ47_12240, partial [Candidatus Hydrogenedentes bacterium]|nr:hypothetical protein [Candidatus Hydrogenedentota bacterium]
SRIRYLLVIPIFLLPGAALLLFNLLGVWWHGYWPTRTRLHYTLVIAACLGLLPFLHYWNLIGFRW